MPEKKNVPHVLKKRIVWPRETKRERISLPTSWPSFHYEYDAPVIWMPPAPAIWAFDFSFANRGAVDQLFYVLLTEFHYAPDQPTTALGPNTSRAGRIFLVNLTIDLIGSGEDSSAWWARMFVASRDVIPSLHVYAGTPVPDTDPPYYPDFYFSPGDFAYFEIPGGYVPPGIWPIVKP